MSKHPRPCATRRAARHTELRPAPIAFAALMAISGLQANAQPLAAQLPMVRQGGVQINAVIHANTGTVTNPVMNITQTQSASNRGVIEWIGFSIGANARVNITQPTAQSVLINRVVGPVSAGVSEIYGSLNSNGRVFLVNPSGVVFGPNAQVNVGSLVATSLDLSPTMTSNNYAGALSADAIDFSSIGRGTVEVLDGAVITTAAGGSVVLLSDAEVRQNGVIEAVQGRVTLAGASDAAIVPLGTSGFVDLVIAPNNDFSANISTSGSSRTTAAGGSIIIGGADNAKLRSDNLSVDGTVSAASATGNGGSVLIHAGANGFTSIGASGVADASSTAAGGTGGSVVVDGSSITLQSSGSVSAATVRADGPAGGGNITLGGTDTRALNINTGTIVSADATASGNGGTILARATFSNLANGNEPRIDYGVAEIYGNLLARGGINGGNGGRIETSGTHLNTALNSSLAGLISATIDARARAGGGLSGSWSIDPFNVTISNNTSTDFTGTYIPTGPGANLRAADISAALDAGTSVEISTGTANAGSDSGIITLATGTAITRNAGTTPATLTLRAHDNIILESNTSITGTAASPLHVKLFSDLDGDGAGGVALQGQVQISTGGGGLSIGGGIDPLTGFAAGGAGVAGISIMSSNLSTAGASTAGGDIMLRGLGGGGGGGNGVAVSGGSISGHHITIVGRSAGSAAVSLSGTTLATSSGTIDIRGVAVRSASSTAQTVGVDLSGTRIELGAGSLIAAGRGDDNGLGPTAIGEAAIGLRHAALSIDTAGTTTGSITLVGEAAGSAGPGLKLDSSDGGDLSITAGGLSNTATPANIILGAISSTGLAMDFGESANFGTVIRTQGAINIRPLGVDSTGALVERTAAPISIGAVTASSRGFIVDPLWLVDPAAGGSGFSAGGGVVVGSSLHSGAIGLGDNTLANHAGLSLTLQNQGTSSGGITLGSGNTVRDLGLLTAGNVTQTGPLTVTGNLVIQGDLAGNVTLNNQANTIGVLAFDPPNALAVTTQGDLKVDAASIQAFNATAQGFAGQAITANSAGTSAVLQSLAGSVLVNQPITLTGTGANVLDLVSPTAVTIANGALLTPGTAGRVRAWAPAVTGMASPTNFYGCAFGATVCASGITLPVAAGQQAIFSTRPTLTVTANPASGTVGSTLPALTFTSSGLVNGDTAAQALGGALATTATSAGPAGTYPITAGTLASPTGYLINFTPATLTLAAAPVPPPPMTRPDFTLEAVRSEYLTEFRSDVYGRNLSRPFVCTASSLVRDSLTLESTSDPLASEWGKVRQQPQLSGCLDVNNGGQCAAF